VDIIVSEFAVERSMRIKVICILLWCGSALAQTADQRPPGLTGENWQFGPLNRWAYSHIREILPTKDIPNAGARIRPISGIETAAADLAITLDGKSVQLSDAIKTQYVDGILVIRDGEAIVEIYQGTLTAEKTHLLWSVSKTITGLTAASVAAEGLIDLDKTVAHYVPKLASSGWGQDRLRDILDMRDSSDWTEDYSAPDSTVRRQDCADGLLTGAMCDDAPVVGNYVFLPGVGRDRDRKGKFEYKSGTTDVMAWVLEAATGQRFADLVSAHIWKPIGAERSAGITVDVSGFTLASGGMVATLRDIGRVGLLMLNRGKAGDRQVIPAAWMDDIFSQPGDPEWTSFRLPGTDPYYRSFVWGVGDGQGTVYANGVHGQNIYVSPATGTVIAVFSSWPDAIGGAPGVGKDAMFGIFEAILNATD
jgi:CubicO group peptidase (beta-lactamase class C family)